MAHIQPHVVCFGEVERNVDVGIFAFHRRVSEWETTWWGGMIFGRPWLMDLALIDDRRERERTISNIFPGYDQSTKLTLVVKLSLTGN
jgi:hypothetical protein